jgi:hypothetical protein
MERSGAEAGVIVHLPNTTIADFLTVGARRNIVRTAAFVACKCQTRSSCVMDGSQSGNRAEEYRLKAQNCLFVAKAASGEGNRVRLVQLALYWFRLADQAAKNGRTDLVDEWPPRPADRPLNSGG